MTHLVPVLRPVLGSPLRRMDVYRIAGAMPSLHLSPRLRGDWTDLISGVGLTTFTRANTSPTYELDGVGGLTAFTSGQRAIGYSPETGLRGGSIFGQRTQGISDPTLATGWTASNATFTPNAATAPGGISAGLLVENTSSGTHVLQRSYTFNASTTYVFSGIAKAGPGSRNIRLTLPTAAFGVNPSCQLQLTSSPVSTSSLSSPLATFLIPLADGWYRWAVAATTSATGGTGNININLVSGSTSYPGDGTSGVYVTGVNMTDGGVLFPYLGGAITCPADVLTIETAQLGSLWQAGSTIVAHYSRQPVLGADIPAVAAVHGGTTSNRILLGYETASASRLQIFTAGASLGAATPSASGNRRTMAATADASSGISVNGGADSTFSVATMPTVNQIRLGADATGSNPGQLYLHDFLIFPPGTAASRRVQLSAAFS